MVRKPPANGAHAAWRGRFRRCVHKHGHAGGELDPCTQRLRREADCMVIFLSCEGVDPMGTDREGSAPVRAPPQDGLRPTSPHGEDDISELLSLHEACRLNGMSAYAELKTALEHQVRGRTPSFYWIRKVGMKAGAKPPHVHRLHRLSLGLATAP